MWVKNFTSARVSSGTHFIFAVRFFCTPVATIQCFYGIILLLPKIYGSYDKIWNPLVEMLGELLNTREDYSGLDADALIDKLKQISGGTIKSLELNGTAAKTYFKYPKSAIKIVEMLEDLELAGFATYIK